MTSIGGLALAAAVAVAAGLTAACLVRLAPGRSSGRPEGRFYGLSEGRSAGWWSYAGAVAAPLGPGAAALAAIAGASAPAVALAGLLGGLAALPMTAGLSLRQMLDGLMVGGSVYFVVWHHVLLPGRGGLGGAWLVPASLAVAVASAGWSTGVVVAVRSRRALVGALSLGLVSTGPLALALGLATGWPPPWLAATAAPVALGVLAGAVGPRFAAPAPPVTDDTPPPVPFGAVPTLFTVGVTTGETVLQMARAGSLGQGSAAVCVPIAVMLGLRLTLALRDARRYAERLAVSEAHFRVMADTDPLTGLANRRHLRRALDSVPSDAPRTLLALDVDDFKDVNDMCGHDIGDAVLVEVGRRLKAHVPPGDLAVRLGGDEFAVLTCVSPAEARGLAERLLGVLSGPYVVGDGILNLSASIGLAPCDSAREPDGMMRNADLALRFAKKNGKRRVEPFAAAYARWLQRRIAIERDLRNAMAHGELTVAYQPVVALPSGRPVGAEALLRWRHPTLGPVQPSEFVPIAEETGLIGELGAWVRHEACRQLARWGALGHDVWLSVNVSVRELRSPDFVAQVVDVLRLHDVPPARLTLELTEHHVAQDIDELAWTLVALREVGVRVALDDFGAGYSSLGQLRQLAVDVLKIDRALVAEPMRAPYRTVGPLVDVIVRLGHRLGLDVIAEGVEEPEHRAVVERARCRLGQGYLFGRPMPAERLEALLAMSTHPALPAVPSSRSGAYSGTRR